MPRNKRQTITLPRASAGGGSARSNLLKGAVSIPRSRLTQASLRAYPPAPPGWRGPMSEWAVYDYLTRVKKFVPNRDFFYQSAMAFAFFARGFQRVDFLLPAAPRGRVPAPAGYFALAFDPVNPFTHRNASLDRLKRTVLASQGVLLIWIDTAALEVSPAGVLELALKGIDISSKARGH